MWDEPRMLNGVANAIFVLAFALLAYAAGAALAHSPAFLLRVIRVEGDLGHVSRGQIVDALQGRVRGTFFTVDLEAIRSAFEAIPWVRRAEVRRHWPDRLDVRLEEHVALARWGQQSDGLLVDTHGDVFAGHSDAALPILAGPPGSEREVARRYAQFRALLEPLALDPLTVTLSQRSSWQLRLSNGLAVQIGRDSEKDPVRERFERFVDLYPQTLGRRGHRFEYVDLRYRSGFALRVPELPRSEPPKLRSRARTDA